ncbi:hypothetical protein Trydic_g7182 [Trypoxylus dichotomus]
MKKNGGVEKLTRRFDDNAPAFTFLSRIGVACVYKCSRCGKRVATDVILAATKKWKEEGGSRQLFFNTPLNHSLFIHFSARTERWWRRTARNARLYRRTRRETAKKLSEASDAFTEKNPGVNENLITV